MPPSIPADLADTIIPNHGDPPVWWVGQFVKYIMQPQPNLRDKLKAVEDKYDLGEMNRGPTVGIQIRRTDKVKEAKLYNVNEYMIHVS